MLSNVKTALINWVFAMYIDTGSPVPNIPSKSHGLADENKKFLTEWKWFETTVLDQQLHLFFFEVICCCRESESN